MNFLQSNTKFYLPLLAAVFSLFLIGAGSSDKGLRDVINPNTVEDTRSEDRQIIDMFGGRECGDGLVQQGEQCDPPGETKNTGNSCNTNKGNGIEIKECGDNCKWKSPTCKPIGVCGNGVVESGEQCDDGSLNGTYGSCATNCQGPSNKYCGNGSLDKDNSGNPLEACDTVAGKCVGANGNSTSTPCSNYATSSLASCAPDCQSRGNYCGDGTKQAQEECDDGNNNNTDKCKNNCTINKNKVDPKAEPKCGNGLVEEDETCDQGDRNGIRCTPEYGQSCTYCSADCQNILTIDTSNFCGDGKLNQFGTDDEGKPQYEVCDLNSNREVIAPMGYQTSDGGWITTEIALVLDDTGSMGPYINDLKNNVKSFLNQQKSASAGVVTFKDQANTGMDQQFTTNFNQIEKTLSNITATGGGDSNECVSCGIATAMNNLNWHDRTKKVMIVASLDGAKNCQKLTDLANQAKSKGIKIYTVTKNASNGCETELINNIPNITNGGNFKLGQNWNNTLGQISKGISKQTGSVISCPDKGSYSCGNQCKDLQNGCVECNTYQGNDSKPKIALLNPMIAGQEKQQFVNSGNNVDRRWGARKDGGSLSNFDINRPDDDLSKLFLLRPSAPVGIDYPGGYLSDKDHFRNSQNSNNITPFNSNNNFRANYSINGNKKEMIALGNKRYLIDRNKANFRDISKYTQIFFSNNKSLQSDKMCSGEYKVAFNANSINSSTSQSNEFFKGIIDSYKNQSDPQKDQTTKGDLFDYPVNGESGEIKNSYITSPAVPPGAMRIVVKWTGNEARKWSGDNSGEFEGNIYSQVLFDGDKINRSWFRSLGENNLSNQVEVREINNKKYWWPPSYDIREGGGGAKIAVHGKTSPPDNSKVIQSMTINNLEDAEHTNGTKLQDGEQIAFYVSTLGRPIQPFQNGKLEVYVYTYQDGQDPLYSIYKPTYKFKISSSTHSGNPLAPYWHTFNIMKVNCKNTDTWAITDLKGRIIAPGHSSHGRVTTRFNDIKKTTKSKTNNYDCSKVSNLDYIDNSQGANFSQSSGSNYGNNYFNILGSSGFNIFLESGLSTDFSSTP